jgi:Barstar (barnase inhibitor)
MIGRFSIAQYDHGVSTTSHPVLIIDGARFDDLAGFAREFSKHLHDYVWHGSLDAFNDILRGGFGTPEQGFVLRWLHSDRSREALGWKATIAWLEDTIARCHPSNREHLGQELAAARHHEGTTLFDRIIEIIREHGPGGREAEDAVELDLR